jgi:hypothetical protein
MIASGGHCYITPYGVSCAAFGVLAETIMAIGSGGCILIDVEPEFKQQLHVVLRVGGFDAETVVFEQTPQFLYDGTSNSL